MRRSAAAGAVLLLGATLAPAVAAATGPSDRRLTQLVLTTWDQREGLPVSSVTDLAQTPDGELWLATPEGLVRFDGRRFDRFHAGNTEGLEHQVVATVLWDERRDTLWVGGHDGLFAWREPRLVAATTASGEPLAHVDRLALGPDGALWASHRGGLGVLRDRFVEPFVLPDGTALPDVEGVAFAADGTVWIAAGDVLRLRGEDVERFGLERGIETAPLAIAIADGEVVVGCRGIGVRRLEGERFVAVPGAGGSTPLGFAASAGTLWVATLGRGLGRLRSGRYETLGHREGLATDDVFAALVDRDGNVWLGTQGGGLARLHAGDFATTGPPEGLPHPNVAAVFEDAGGRLWAGTSGGGLFVEDGDGWRRVGPDRGLEPVAIMTLAEDRRGRLWIGTGDAGAWWRGASGRFRRLAGAEASVPPTVFGLTPLADGMVVAGVKGAVWTDGVSTRSIFSAPPGEPWISTGALAEDDALWIGSIRTGLARVVPGDGPAERFGAAEGLDADSALVLHRDESGALWIGTFGGGLARRAPDRSFAALRVRDGLCEDVIYSLLEDDAGAFWMGGNRGVCRVERRRLERRLGGEPVDLEARLYSVADGLRAGETSGGPDRSAIRGADGRLHFATPAGVATVDPRRLLPPPTPPAVRVEALVCGDRSLPLGDRRAGERLPPAARDCELRIRAAELGGRATVRMEARIDDEAWSDLGDRRAVGLGGLAPGPHEIAVRARVIGAAAGPPAVLAFEVAPRWHESNPIRASLLAALVVAAAVAYRLKTGALVARRRELEREVATRTHELRLAKGDLERANETLEQRVQQGIAKLRHAERLAAYGELVASVAHEVRQPVFALQASAYVLASKLDASEGLGEPLRIVELETRRIGTLMEDLLEFARPAELRTAPANVASLLDEAIEVHRTEQGDGGPEVERDVDPDLGEIRLDRARIVQVLVNLLGNARRHAHGATRVRVAAERSPELEGGLRIVVEDDGPGLAESIRDRAFEPFVTSGAGSGLGLAIVRRVVDQHGGRATAEPAPSGGLRIVLELPGG